ncbi:MAG: acetyl-CoA carboxylase biotin carboxylase subunit [Candidatus Acidiferrales bacterium]
MFRKILIANRGEIALRILSACRELGVKTVAVYSEADRNSLHVRFADEAICIGPPRSSESYLNIPQVISAAEIANVDAIHPGYGFLSENANFAEVCEASHITFIGPSPDAIRLMGEKDKAREAMKEAGLPIIPGSPGVVADEESAKRIAAEIGYPVMIKAAEGGGGRGMRIVRHSRELISLYQTARTEAEQAFGSPNVYMEKLIEHPRHIEFQVLGDKHGNVIHLGERECSLQRRHQKVLEESPSLAMDPATRKRIGKQVVDALKKLGYSSAGTVEFLREESGQLYFIEMNARIQVEHPVTEMVTGVDLVKSQIRVAAGEKLSDVLARVEFRGHAIECRINAEDPETFTPSAGRITAFRVPGGPGIRVDTACYADGVIPPYYDSLIAKIIAHGDNRAEAIARMNRALDGFVVEGIKTTIALHKRILADPDFIAGKFDTHFLDRPAAVAANK